MQTGPRLSRLLHRAAFSLLLLLSACAGGQAETGPSPMTSLYGAYMAGNYAAATGHEADAAAFFAAAIARDPTNHDLLRRGFVAALLSHSPERTALARRMGNDPLALMVLGNAAVQAGNYARATQEFTAIPQAGINTLIRPLLLSWAEAGAGDPGTAIARLKGLDTSSPFGPVYALNAALIADFAGREAEAAPLYQTARAAFPASNLRLAQALASWQARQGNSQSADAVLVSMVASHPDLELALPALERDAAKPLIGSARDGIAEAYLTLAGSLTRPEEALLRQILLGFALELRPGLAPAHLLQANVDANLNKPDKAAATLAAIGPDDPLYAPAAMQRAQILDSLGKGDTMLPTLTALARAHPDSAAPLALAGDIERDAGHFAKARDLYSSALARLGPNPPRSAWAIVYGRAIAEDKLGNWPAAEADLHRALALNPGQPFVLNYLGYSWALRGEHLDKAQKMIEQALQVDPNEGAIIDSLGYILLKRGKIAEAMKVQIGAVHLAPDDPEVNAHLADIFYAAGDHLAARNQWSRALSLHPDPTEKARIEAALKSHGIEIEAGS